MSRRPREFAGSPPLYSSPVPPHHLILPVVSPSCVCVSTRIITLCLITQTTPYGQWECRIDRHVDKCGGTVRCYLLCSLVTTLLTTFLAGGEAMTKRFSIFWGCTIPARFPFVEKSTRVMLDDLGATVEEVDGFTCCPEGTLVKAVDEEAYCRNVIVVLVHGLYQSTFRATGETVYFFHRSSQIIQHDARGLLHKGKARGYRATPEYREPLRHGLPSSQKCR